MNVRWSALVFQLLTVGALALAAWRLIGHTPYRIDVEVYRMGAQAWLDGRPLYSDGVTFHTQIGLDLPFTYPPLAAVVFVPLSWLSFPAASVVMTVITLVLLIIAMTIVLTSLDVSPRVPAAAAITAAAVLYLEPIQANFAFGQINVVLMTLVLADCLPKRTRWPRGVLLGLAIALKLTPAVFLLYFGLRRDGRAALTAVATFAVATLVGFALTWRDSLEYWTATVQHTDRIGSAALNTNQNIAGVLARLELTSAQQFILWTVASFAVLGLTVWAASRALRAGESALALVCVALFGLVVSPVSWSHHWVWALPAVVVTAVLAYRRRNLALAAVAAAGVALMVWHPLDLLPKHQETTASLWRQLAGASYVWWALAALVVTGATIAAAATRESSTRRPPTAPTRARPSPCRP